MELQTVLLAYVCCIMVTHWIGEFVLQSPYMAKNKSTSLKALFMHVLAYGLTLFIGLYVLNNSAILGFQLTMNFIIFYVVINFIAHFIIDYIASKISKHYWLNKNYRKFFLVFGFEQLLYAIILIGTLNLLTF